MCFCIWSGSLISVVSIQAKLPSVKLNLMQSNTQSPSAKTLQRKRKPAAINAPTTLFDEFMEHHPSIKHICRASLYLLYHIYLKYLLIFRLQNTDLIGRVSTFQQFHCMEISVFGSCIYLRYGFQLLFWSSAKPNPIESL